MIFFLLYFLFVWERRIGRKERGVREREREARKVKSGLAEGGQSLFSAFFCSCCSTFCLLPVYCCARERNRTARSSAAASPKSCGCSHHNSNREERERDNRDFPLCVQLKHLRHRRQERFPVASNLPVYCFQRGRRFVV